MASVEQDYTPPIHYKRRATESEGEQVQQLITPKKTTSSSRSDGRNSPRSGSIPKDSFHIMSYPENQRPTSSATQGNGNGSANTTTQTPASPSSLAMERWMGERTCEEPFHGQRSAGPSTNTNNGTSTRTDKKS
ncbi:hypothetical protein PMIN01_06172 [Paraphaeosphaeria minitans]|uniref:Uncharacterized protein n=1 Tax=Paraphaeosphaeria minitans TaxID=565426 RepID=A0A9P6GIH8_9PLEO|nr:hypothetical protein PMIN01_06172 [Paraphaeosphaeria minitans]